MIKAIPTISAILLTTILLTGTISPYSFATNYDDDDEFSDENCGCEKPSKFTVEYHGDDNVDIEVFKNYGQWRSEKSPLHVFTGVNDGDHLTMDSELHMNGKDKLSSNLVYNVINGADSKLNSIGIAKVHISCSEPLFVGQIHTAENNDGITFTVIEGLDDDGDDSVFADYICPINEIPDTLTCNGNLVNFYTLEHGAMQGDSENPSQGTINSYLNSIDGSSESGDITLSVQSSKNQGTIYDSDVYPIGADPDLQEVEDKKILIIAENIIDANNDGLIDNPDDASAGGSLQITFEIPQTIQSLLWVDLDNGESVTITATDTNGNTIVELVGDDGPTGNGLTTPVLFPEGTENIVELDFALTSSGGLTDICIQETPVQTGTIKVIKETQPTSLSGATFSFTTDGEELDDFVLDTDPNTSESDTQTFAGIMAGEITRTIEETAESAEGYDTSLECVTENGNSVFSIVDRKVTITKLAASDILTCTYTNVAIIPPTGTLTLFKSVTSDNGVTIPADSEFNLNVTGVSNAIFATPMVINANEPITIEIGEPDDYSRVIISGDNCPAVSDFEGDNAADVMLTDGENRICTFYYDDEFQETSGGQGIIFHRNSLQFDPSDPMFGDNCIATSGVTPCVEEVVSFFQYKIKDSALQSETTVVVYSMIPIGGASIAACPLLGITPDGSDLSFEVQCSSISSGVHNVNYALIETEE